MDETLIHFFFTHINGIFFVRPYCLDFLHELNDLYEIITFTAGTKDYADTILNQLDINGDIIKYRLYRQHTSILGCNVFKDLSKIGRDLSKTIIIDNLRENYQMQPNNGIFIKTLISDVNDVQFRAAQPASIREADDETLFEWYHKDLFNYTVKVYYPELLQYMGYKHTSVEQAEAIKQRIKNLSRVAGIMEFESQRLHCRREFLLMDPGFEDETNVLYIHSPYMNKLVERVIRDKIPRMIKTQSGNMKPLLDANGRQLYYPEVTTLIRPEISTAKNKRATIFTFTLE